MCVTVPPWCATSCQKIHFAAFIPADIAVGGFLYRPDGISPDSAQASLSSILSSVTGHPASSNEHEFLSQRGIGSANTSAACLIVLTRPPGGGRFVAIVGSAACGGHIDWRLRGHRVGTATAGHVRAWKVPSVMATVVVAREGG